MIGLKGEFVMIKTKLAICTLATAGLLSSAMTADAKSHKHPKHHSSMTTGTNMKSGATGGAANPSSQGNVGPGTTNNSGAK
jgi:hypothetical protein